MCRQPSCRATHYGNQWHIMGAFLKSLHAYETWLKAELHGDLHQPDLDKKHDKMKSGAFAFLRATYWRWSETILEICPKLATAPMVMAIGDTHLENFGTWRDVEGRLVWGANDFDDAALMPYPLDLVRLAVSASLARKDKATSVRDICDAILKGYDKGLTEPEPIILDKGYKKLRATLVLPDDERKDFWDKFEDLELEPNGTQPAYELALREALPEFGNELPFARRTAGTGSLGRPRFVAKIRWKGGPVLREAKALVPSGWLLAHKRGETTIHAEAIATGRVRSPDPHYRVKNRVLVRRLAPNSRQIEVKDDPKLLSQTMLVLMGQEIANCHSDDAAAAATVKKDLTRRDPEWLRDAVKKVAPIVEDEQAEFADRF